MMAWIYILPIFPQQQRQLLWQAMIYCYLLTSSTITASNNEFNNQIMPRVLETIDTYLNMDQLWNIIRYRDLDMFEYGFTIADHTLLSTLLYSSSYSPISPYMSLALEDGTSIIPDSPPFHYMYLRGSGQSGYKVLDAKRSDHPDHKHLISCVNETNGEPKDCIADVGQPYIECVNDCELIPCPNTSTNDSGSNSDDDNSATNGNASHTSNETSNDILSSLPKWCANYIVKEVQPEEEGLLGYIPRTSFCLNVNGQPEQRPGYVLTDNNTLGNCYYEDGITIVNRTVSGQYAFCGPNKTCNAFAGGFYSSDAYDPRFRPWYIEAKLAQQAAWSQPYLSYGDNDISIDYNVPLYNYQNTETGTIQTSLLHEIANSSIVDDISLRYRQIFAGVIGVTIDISRVTQFLVDEYANTTMRVFVVEQNPNDNGTNYMVASSTGQTLKLLLLSDPDQPCPEGSFLDTNVCTVERLSIQELGDFYVGGNSTTTRIDNLIFYRAYMEFENLNFPTTRQINFLVNEADVYSKAYVGQTKTYHQPNLDWRVFVILPMDRSTNDTVTVEDPSFACICIFASVGLVGCLVLLMTFYQKRTERAVINADWRFTCSFIFGCAILNLSTFTMLGENTNPMCMLRMWCFNALFVCALSPLFIKVWRMSKLLRASTGFKRTNVSNFQAFLYTLPFIAIEIIILTIFSFVDPPRQTGELGVGVGIGVQQITCQQRNNAFFITQISYCSILLFIGCVLAYRTRNLNPKYGEAKQLGFCMYNITFTGIVVVLVIKLVDIDTATQIMLQAVSILWGSFFCSLAFVLPRLLEASKDRRLLKSRRSSHFTFSNTPSSTYAVTSYDTPSQKIFRNSNKYNNMLSTNTSDVVEGDDTNYESKPFNDHHAYAITTSHVGT